MQEFIAYGRVADIPADAVGTTTNGHASFKFEFVCDSSLLDESGKPFPSFFHVQVYGKQAEWMAQSLSKGSPILLKGEIIQRPYTNQQGQRRTYQYISVSKYQGITFLETKEAANRRKQGGLPPASSVSAPEIVPSSTSYPTPLDADEPF